MKKTKIAAMFIALSIIFGVFMSPADVYAASGIVVTPETFGSDPSIHTVLIGYDVTEIQDGSFSKLKNLKEIKVDGRNPYYASCNGVLYYKNFTVLLCIPQNTTSVQMKTTVRSYTPHALDGLSQSRKEALYDFIRYSTTPPAYGKNTSENHTVEPSVTAETTPTAPAQTEETTPTVPAETEEYSSESLNDVASAILNPTPPPAGGENFSQYVFEEDGYTCFRYTGTGQSRIIIPEGVQKVLGFTDYELKHNDEITYVYIPKSVISMRNMNTFNTEEYGHDNNGYNCLYQCTNLQTVESASWVYISEGNSLYRPLADGSKLYVWSSSQKYVYDPDRYYTSGSVR